MDSQALHDVLLRLATNYRWTWTPSCRNLLMSLPGADPAQHPLEAVSGLSEEQLCQLADDEEFVSEVFKESAGLAEAVIESPPTIAYCSPEFGISSFVPQYSGGLGVLAGDFLKAAGDAGLPLAGVGLFYHQGAFRQVIKDGEQGEIFSTVEPEKVGAVDTGIEVEVPFPGREVRARVWRMDIGGVPLILLDTDVELNSEKDRAITDRLYMGSEQHRIDQEMVLGIGGARALAALGWNIEIYHLNEGHAGFITLELVDRVIRSGDLPTAVARVRKDLVFTTHTPVQAGIDKLKRDTLGPYLELWAQRWDVEPGDLWRLGSDPGDGDAFNMAVFCLRMSRAANGVSKLHGEVSRGLFSDLEEGSRIGHVTNGVHARTWTGDAVQAVFDDVLGAGWSEGLTEAWDLVDGIDDDRLIEIRRQGSLRLSELVSSTGVTLDPDALIVGFARRFAPYKRANLILRQRDRLVEMLADDDRPVHFLFAGKAHPSNELAKTFLSQILDFSESTEANSRFSFIPDYDMAIASHLVQGCDIWLNNPIRPREASGTSGEKVALNGGLNCSILDGWWAEMFDGENGWAVVASEATDPEVRDSEDSAAVIDALLAARDEYYESRDVFNRRIRGAWRTLGPRVTAARMLRDYETLLYAGSYW
ncbi:MAG: alpha-glucan family phosphorylase [Acidimicrobiia bacterium]